MISVIIVGKNEGLHLRKCIESALRLIHSYANLDFEVLYIDSKSSDNSVEIAKAYSFLRVFLVLGDANSAVARNIGANMSKGSILFFVDADMEIQQDFLKFAINDSGTLVSDFVTGHIDDYFYTYEGEFIKHKPRTYKKVIPSKFEELNYSGGMFLTYKKIWNSVGGMNTKFRRSQDIDFTLRLKKNKYKLCRVPVLAVFHHTIAYNNEKRMWKDLWEGNYLYPGLILRTHFYNINVIFKSLRSNYTAFLLTLLLVSIFTNRNLLYSLSFFYLIVLVFRVLLNTRFLKNKFFYFLERVPFQLLTDLFFIGGFVLFFPSDHKEKYKEV